MNRPHHGIIINKPKILIVNKPSSRLLKVVDAYCSPCVAVSSGGGMMKRATAICEGQNPGESRCGDERQVCANLPGWSLIYRLVVCLLLSLAASTSKCQIVINEVMYNPAPVALSANAMRLINGIGSLTFMIDQPGEINVWATVDGLAERRSIQVLDNPAELALTGTLSGSQLNWQPADGVISLTSQVTVPAGSELVIQPGTLVMLGAQARLRVQGGLQCSGSLEEPIYFFAENEAAPWAQVLLVNAGNSYLLEETIFVGGGDTPLIGHSAGPAVYAQQGNFEMRRCTLVDHAGKAFYTESATSRLRDCLFSCSALGAELRDGDIEVRNCYITDIWPGSVATDDNDGLYVGGPGDNIVDGCVVAYTGDDGIDTLSSSPSIRNCIIYGTDDKGISVNRESPVIENCLVFNCQHGIVMKNQAVLNIIHTTIADCERNGHWVRTDISPSMESTLDRVILWGSGTPLATDIAPQLITITYSNIPDTTISTAGHSNITSDPLFVDPSSFNFPLPGPRYSSPKSLYHLQIIVFRLITTLSLKGFGFGTCHTCHTWTYHPKGTIRGKNQLFVENTNNTKRCPV
jgi:hypothetical protein